MPSPERRSRRVRGRKPAGSRPRRNCPSLEIILDTPVEDFAEKVACQHYILSYGNTTEQLKAFCRLNQFAFI